MGRGTLEHVDYLLNRTVAPTNEPVTTAMAKQQCRVDLDETYFDSWFGASLVSANGDSSVNAIKTARELVENKTQLALMPQTCELRLSAFPCDEEIDLRFHPVYSATVTYYDENESSQTWSSSNYDVRQERKRSVLVKASSSTDWPTLSSTKRYPITLTLSCGYANPATYATAALQRGQVPGCAKHAILMLVGHWFRQRESVLVGTISKEIEHGFMSLVKDISPVRYP